MGFYFDISSCPTEGLVRCQEVNEALTGSNPGTLLTVSLAVEARHTGVHVLAAFYYLSGEIAQHYVI